MLILNIQNGLQVIIWLPLRCIFAFALSTLIEDGGSRLWILSAWVQSKFDALFLLQFFHHQLEKTTIDFQRTQHVDLDCPNCPVGYPHTSPAARTVDLAEEPRSIFGSITASIFLEVWNFFQQNHVMFSKKCANISLHNDHDLVASLVKKPWVWKAI